MEEEQINNEWAVRNFKAIKTSFSDIMKKYDDQQNQIRALQGQLAMMNSENQKLRQTVVSSLAGRVINSTVNE